MLANSPFDRSLVTYLENPDAAVPDEWFKLLTQAFGEGNFAIEHLTDPRQRFSVQVTAKGTPVLADVIKRLG